MILWIILLVVLLFVIFIGVTLLFNYYRSRDALYKFLMEKLSKEDYHLYIKWSSPNIYDIVMFRGELK